MDFFKRFFRALERLVLWIAAAFALFVVTAAALLLPGFRGLLILLGLIYISWEIKKRFFDNRKD